MPRPLKLRGTGNYGVETASLQRILRKVAEDPSMNSEVRRKIIASLNEAINLFNRDAEMSIGKEDENADAPLLAKVK